MGKKLYTTGGINAHNNKRAVRRAASLGLDQFTFNEGQKRRGQLFALRNYRVTNLASSGFDKKRKPLWANPIITKKQFQSVGSVMLQANDRSAPYKIAPPRTIVVEMIQHPQGRIARINFHNHAALKDLGANHPRAKEADELADVLDQVITLVKMRVDHIVASGDANISQKEKTPGWVTPWEVLHAHGLVVKTWHIDGVAYSKSLTMSGFMYLPKKNFSTDHDGFRANFRSV